MLVISTSSHTNKLSSEKSYVTIGVCDQDQSEYSRLLLTYINESELFTRFAAIIEETQEELQTQFANGELDMYFVIPEHFTENMINIENVPIQVTLSTKEKTKAIILKDMLTAYGQYITAVELHCVTLYDAMVKAGMPAELCESENVAVSYQLVFTALGKSDLFTVHEESSVRSIPLTIYYAYQVLFFAIALFAILAGLDLLKERSLKTMARLLTTQTKAYQIVGAKFLSNAIAAAVILVLVIACMIRKNLSTYAGVLLFAYLTFLCLTSFFLLLCAFFRTAPGYLLTSNILILFSAILGGGVLPARYLPEPLSTIAGFTPNGYFLTHILSLYQDGLALTWTECGIILGLTFVFLLLTSVKCRSREGGSSDEI